MIRDNTAALVVNSTTRPVAEVTARLGLEPWHIREIGTETPNSRRLPPNSAPRYWKDSRWIVSVDDDGPDDPTGFGSVRMLLAALEGREEAVRSLQDDYNVWIVWTGHSDSEQGGFVIPSELFPQLALLGLDIYANASWYPPDSPSI